MPFQAKVKSPITDYQLDYLLTEYTIFDSQKHPRAKFYHKDESDWLMQNA